MTEVFLCLFLDLLIIKPKPQSKLHNCHLSTCFKVLPKIQAAIHNIVQMLKHLQDKKKDCGNKKCVPQSKTIRFLFIYHYLPKAIVIFSLGFTFAIGTPEPSTR